MFNLVIIGAGASGLAAAVTAKNCLLLEKMPRVGKKILVTGNGRCNLGNRHVRAHEYQNKDFAAPALQAFGAAECEAFFHSLGLALQEDSEGRLYPRSNTAASVLDALRYGAIRAGAEIKCDSPVTQIKIISGGFLLNENIKAHKIIIAAGGCAAPAHGSDGSGFSLLRGLGHSIVEPKPALVQIKCASPLLGMLKGLRVRAKILIERDTQVLRQAEGEILFTEDGLSGIAAMEVSREARAGCVAVLDLLPEYSCQELMRLLEEWQVACPEYNPAQLLAGLLSKRVAEAVIKNSPPRRGGTNVPGWLTTCKRFCFSIAGTRGFAHAQVTAGGVDVREFIPKTLESRLAPGLYACGEALDVDGCCGGFNLHWAWASGVLAGQLA